VVLYTDVAHRAGYEGHTDSSGRLNLSVRSSDAVFEKIVVLPKAGFWSRVKKGESVASSMVFSLDPLPVNGFDWGLNATDAASRGGHRGKGVKVAIVDSGIAPHPSLAVFGGKNFIDGESEGAWQDLDGHGTHCAGVVAALDAVASVWGYAPKVELYALRVFGGVDGGGYASDIGDAIEWAIQAGCDVISMSLGSATASSYIRSKIEKATDAGTLCVAATGNEAGDVSYPAKFRNVVGVAAVGKAGTFPEDSIHADAKSNFKSSDSHYFLASFSNRGDDVDLCAPGVAVTSTLPTDTFGAWDGTSMACPHVAGIAALALEASPIIQQAARDAGRMGLLFDRVLGLCTDLGMAKAHQGSGLPRLSGVFTP
jgi:subtilisin family serine protease